jgi:hypothetical protein
VISLVQHFIVLNVQKNISNKSCSFWRDELVLEDRGRKKSVRYFEIPDYFREKIAELKDWVKHMADK